MHIYLSNEVFENQCNSPVNDKFFKKLIISIDAAKALKLNTYN
jgi:hypothetical protein